MEGILYTVYIIIDDISKHMVRVSGLELVAQAIYQKILKFNRRF